MSNPLINEQPDQTASNDVERLFDRLQRLLEQQLEQVHQGSVRAAERSCQQINECVRMLAETHVLDLPAFKDRRGRLERLYRELCLSLAAQREEASNSLNAIRRGKKILKTYGNYTS
jgi:Zn-dependent M32 family carboxypeptidase